MVQVKFIPLELLSKILCHILAFSNNSQALGPFSQLSPTFHHRWPAFTISCASPPLSPLTWEVKKGLHRPGGGSFGGYSFRHHSKNTVTCKRKHRLRQQFPKSGKTFSIQGPMTQTTDLASPLGCRLDCSGPWLLIPCDLAKMIN